MKPTFSHHENFEEGSIDVCARPAVGMSEIIARKEHLV